MSNSQETKQKNNDKKIFDWKFWTILGTISIIPAFISAGLYFFRFFGKLDNKTGIEQEIDCFQYCDTPQTNTETAEIFTHWADNWGLSKSQSIFGQFGDYFGGTVGTFIAIAVLIVTIKILSVQKQELDKTVRELELTRSTFLQEQFEKTFFTLLEKMNVYKDNKDLTQFYLVLRVIYQHIKKYSDKYEDNKDISKKDIVEKYNNIVKLYLDNIILLKIFIFPVVTRDYFIKDKNLFHSDIKSLCEEYSLFENLYISKSTFNGDEPQLNIYNAFLDKEIKDLCLKFFKVSAFKGNYSLMKDRIELEENKDEIERYIKHPDVLYQLYAANNHHIDIEQSELKDILKNLSFDKDDYYKKKLIMEEVIELLCGENCPDEKKTSIDYLNKLIVFSEDTCCKNTDNLSRLDIFQPCEEIISHMMSNIKNDNIIKNISIQDFVDHLLGLICKKETFVVPVKFLYHIFNKEEIDKNWGEVKNIIIQMNKFIPEYHKSFNDDNAKQEYKEYRQEQDKKYQEMESKLLEMIEKNKDRLNINHLKSQ